MTIGLKTSKKKSFLSYKKSFIIAICIMLVFGAVSTFYSGRSYAASSYTLCLYYDQSFCINPEGAGNTTQLGGAKYFNISNSTVWHITYTGSGNCLIESGNSAVMSSGGCTNAAADGWVNTGGTGPIRLQNEATGGYLGVSGSPYNGQFVLVLAPTSGYWYAWAD
jgi:hypothetical protein